MFKLDNQRKRSPVVLSNDDSTPDWIKGKIMDYEKLKQQLTKKDAIIKVLTEAVEFAEDTIDDVEGFSQGDSTILDDIRVTLKYALEKVKGMG